jgi:hypothetical protein
VRLSQLILGLAWLACVAVVAMHCSQEHVKVIKVRPIHVRPPLLTPIAPRERQNPDNDRRLSPQTAWMRSGTTRRL